MDLGLKGRKAIVCAASKGLGRACAISLAREGVDLVITARTADALETTAAEIRKATGVNVTAVPGDISTNPDAPLRWWPARHPISLLTMPVVRRPVISANGIERRGSRRSMPTCWPRSS